MYLASLDLEVAFSFSQHFLLGEDQLELLGGNRNLRWKIPSTIILQISNHLLREDRKLRVDTIVKA